MADIVVSPVAGKADFERFIRLPARLYRGHPGFVPPLLLERRESLRFDKNPFFRHAQAQYWLAVRDGQVVGRISAQIDQAYLERYRDATGHFGLIDAIDDARVHAALLHVAEDWLRARSMRRITGPFSLSVNEEVGLMIDGFDAPSMMLMGYNAAYAAAHVEAAGYAKIRDLIAYDYVVENAPETFGRRLAERLPESGRIKLRRVDMKRFDRDLRLLLDIFNDAWQDNWGFVPFDEGEIVAIGKMLKPLVVRDLAWFVELDGEGAGMILALPNVNEAIADLDGRLLPFGWAKLIWRLKVSGVKTARVPLMGVRMKYRTTPLGAAMALMVIDALRVNGQRLGYKRAELGWILENNKVVRRMIESVGGKAYKTYRLYEKSLA